MTHEAIAFHRSLGFREDAVISFGKRLIGDDPTLYKILHRRDWQQALAAGVFRGCGIHLSTKGPAVETVRRYFANRDDLLLLSVSSQQSGDSIRWESSPDDALFPHVDGDIPLSAITAVHPLVLRDDGTHQFPEMFV